MCYSLICSVSLDRVCSYVFLNFSDYDLHLANLVRSHMQSKFSQQETFVYCTALVEQLVERLPRMRNYKFKNQPWLP